MFILSESERLQLVDAFSWTDRDAFAAGGTLVVVDDGVVVDHMNRVVRTGLFAFPAADAAVFTDANSLLGVEVAGANDFHPLVFSEYADEAVGTGRLAHAAAGAFFPVDDGHPVDNVDCLKFTGLDAVAQS